MATRPAQSQARRRHRRARDADPQLGQRLRGLATSPGSSAGNIALIQRGTCTFAQKVANAEAAGAVGVVIFNEGNPGRTGLFTGSLVDAEATVRSEHPGPVHVLRRRHPASRAVHAGHGRRS